MSDSRMLFYGAIIAMFCVTLLIGNCTYQQKSCTEAALKSNVPPAEIKTLCSFNR